MTSFPGLKTSVPWSRARRRTDWRLSWPTQEENIRVFTVGVDYLFMIHLTTLSLAQGVRWSVNNKWGRMQKEMFASWYKVLCRDVSRNWGRLCRDVSRNWGRRRQTARQDGVSAADVFMRHADDRRQARAITPQLDRPTGGANSLSRTQ